MEITLLNLIPSSYTPEVHLSQYDIGRELKFKLMDGNTEYSVPSGASVTVKATKPSGLGFAVSGTFSGNIVTIVNTETMTNESGRFSAELSISSGATLLGTSNFIFNVEKSPHPKGTTDGDAETLIPELTLLVNEIRESNAKVESMTASAESRPAGSEPTAEYDPDTNNLAFGIPVPEVTAEDLYKAFITKSASGSIASFSDGGDDLPMKSLKVNIVPKQSGSGDPSPSNVRPISGWNSVNVKRIGKNFLAYDRDNGSYVTGDLTYTITDGHITVNGTSTSNYPTLIVANPLPLKAGTYTISKTVNGTVPSGAYLYIIVENSGLPNAPSVRSGNSFTFTLTEDRDVRIVLCAETSGKTWNNVGVDFQIERGSTATAYEPYQGNTYPISLGQTVYGGTLDVVSGVLTIEWETVDLGILTWAYDSSYQFFYTSSLNNDIINVIDTTEHPILSDKFKISAKNVSLSDSGYADMSNYEIAYHKKSMQTVSYLYAKDTSTTNPATFKSSVSGSMLVYKLATPTEITLTPTQVTTLLGNNNIWADSGSVEVEYRADTTLAYEELANAIISLGGNI